MYVLVIPVVFCYSKVYKYELILALMGLLWPNAHILGFDISVYYTPIMNLLDSLYHLNSIRANSSQIKAFIAFFEHLVNVLS